MCGLFFLELGGASIYQMDSTELPKVIRLPRTRSRSRCVWLHKTEWKCG